MEAELWRRRRCTLFELKGSSQKTTFNGAVNSALGGAVTEAPKRGSNQSCQAKTQGTEKSNSSEHSKAVSGVPETNSSPPNVIRYSICWRITEQGRNV